MGKKPYSCSSRAPVGTFSTRRLTQITHYVFEIIIAVLLLLRRCLLQRSKHAYSQDYMPTQLHANSR
jgi:hypothetical protein